MFVEKKVEYFCYSNVMRLSGGWKNKGEFTTPNKTAITNSHCNSIRVTLQTTQKYNRTKCFQALIKIEAKIGQRALV